MLNKICFWLLCIGIVYGFCKGSYQSINQRQHGAEPAATEQTTDSSTATPSTTPPPDGTTMPKVELGLTAAGKRLNEALLDAAKTTIDICIKLIGTMALWLGLLNVAKD